MQFKIKFTHNFDFFIELEYFSSLNAASGRLLVCSEKKALNRMKSFYGPKIPNLIPKFHSFEFLIQQKRIKTPRNNFKIEINKNISIGTVSFVYNIPFLIKINSLDMKQND
ncbi:hypothetical protein BpHYR1_017130 [Brachionus plicatilis]|uniref:Uncharacterized protein n=1 Tax=Brachionus plicatilis TaxID=10195 RepID=A0A3M7P454_BRAPC|nr:hypothetical protein BpHYR1_017130 [Brachionus plicatilis]